MEEWWHNLPYYISPEIARVGSFVISWYWVMYLVGFAFVSVLTYTRTIREKNSVLNKDQAFDALCWMFAGVLIGGRLGYVVFYDLASFALDPLAVINPFAKTGEGWVYRGIYGMSYHGGALAAALALFLWSRKNKINFWRAADFIVPAIPLGYFWGRLGNFLNGELYGRITTSQAGMYFPAAAVLDGRTALRHPSQLYEAFLEGIVLFVILWFLRRKTPYFPGLLSAIYLGGYALARFVVEFYRQPDAHLGFIFGSLTMGQLLSAAMAVTALVVGMRSIVLHNRKIKNNGI